MTRRFHVLGASLIAVLLLGALTAGTASAKKAGLQLSVEKVHAPAGSAAIAGISLQGCFEHTNGTLGSNGKSKDKLSFKGTSAIFCEGESTLTGSITAATLSTGGVAAYKAALVLVTGECGYEFKKLSTAFSPNEGVTVGFGETTGKLDKGVSKSKTCPKTFTTSFVAGVDDSEGEAFETEIA
jgi:hypothetical protein